MHLQNEAVSGIVLEGSVERVYRGLTDPRVLFKVIVVRHHEACRIRECGSIKLRETGMIPLGGEVVRQIDKTVRKLIEREIRERRCPLLEPLSGTRTRIGCSEQACVRPVVEQGNEYRGRSQRRGSHA